MFRCWKIAVCAAVMLGSAPLAHAEAPRDAAAIRAQGLQARLNPAERDARIQELAGWMRELNAADPEALHAVQGDFQFALMLMVDAGIYETLAPATINAVDDALESVFDLDEINRSNRWEPLIYAYGFFNRDVTPGQIVAVREGVAALGATERDRLYPVFPHSIDAVTKGLTMGGLATPEDTREALKIAMPMIIAALKQDPMPGRAFHPPSHAVLVLGPLFERWAADTPEGAIVREYAPADDAVNALLMRQLSSVSARGRELKDFERVYFGRTGRYAANALARRDAREAVPALREELARFAPLHEKDPEPARYLRRALVALGDADARAALEAQIETAPDTVRETAVWLCRNARGEGAGYGAGLLGKLLGCDAAMALERYFESLL